MIQKWAAFGSFFFLASVAWAAEGPIQPIDHLGLSCAGTMTTEGQKPPGGPILADGLVNFRAMRVSGFGIGNEAILTATESKVIFGSRPLGNSGDALLVEGEIDLTSGETSVVVRSWKSPSLVLIAMNLDCKKTSRERK